MRGLYAGVLFSAMLLVSGCTSYYRVTDPSTGNEYYTTEVKTRGSGAVTLRDAATGEEVTLQNSHVSKVSKETYETKTAGSK